MQRTSFAEMLCPLARTLEQVGEWWTLLVVRDVFLGVHRFDALLESLAGISRNVLTARLRSLVAAEVLERRRYQRRPDRYEYHLTERGRELVPALLLLMRWGERWLGKREGFNGRLIHSLCGADIAPGVVCTHCGKPVCAEDVHPVLATK